MEQSDYKKRGYAGLHIMAETRQRLNLVVAQMRNDRGEFITQDAALNYLIDQYANAVASRETSNAQATEN